MNQEDIIKTKMRQQVYGALLRGAQHQSNNDANDITFSASIEYDEKIPIGEIFLPIFEEIKIFVDLASDSPTIRYSFDKSSKSSSQYHVTFTISCGRGELETIKGFFSHELKSANRALSKVADWQYGGRVKRNPFQVISGKSSS